MFYSYFPKDPTTSDTACTDTCRSTSAWKSVPLPDATSGRQRNVSRLRAMGGDPTCVPPDFNSSMLASYLGGVVACNAPEWQS